MTPIHDESAELLIEIGCEELPPKALDTLREAFFDNVKSGLVKADIAFEAESSRTWSSPRRLALLLSAVAGRQPDQQLARRGPSLQAAFTDSGEPTAAARGFARSVGIPVEELETLKTDKGEWLFANVHKPGQSLDDLIFPILERATRQLPVPRPMRWSDHDFSFVRPVHWLVVMHGKRLIEGSLLGQQSGNRTRGHRIHAPGPHVIPQAGRYLEVLQHAYVLADQQQRRDRILEQVKAVEPGAIIDSALLDEVNNLVEWPVALTGSFDEEFLEVPHAALIASMQDHQKFFPVRHDGDGEQVTNRFVAVANLESLDPAAVIEGYERVIRPRLADARFFLEQDLKQPLESYFEQLDQVIFQEMIGTVGDKCRRIIAISDKLAEIIGGDQQSARRAARLAKCDLMTQMVVEFPELQGTMGRYYALASGESPAVADAIAEHYQPRYAGDIIPPSTTGRVVSLADRADTLTGIFAAGQRPSGNKDPFALRRAALGLLRILIEAEIEVPLNRLLALAANELAGKVEVEPPLLRDVRGFVVERLRHYYREQGFATDLINAALASGWETLPDLDRRLRALNLFMDEDAAASLAEANKRIGNILRKSGQTTSDKIDTNLLSLEDERVLFDEVTRLEQDTAQDLESGRYHEALLALATLKQPVDAFFDSVLVMDEDPALRSNRLALLARLKSLFDRIADLSVLGQSHG